MKHSVITIAFIMAVTFFACNSKDDAAKDATKPPTSTDAEVLTRGEYLVQISGCNDCHSPKRPGAHGPELIPELILSGYSAHTPLPKPDSSLMKKGFVVFAPDLTASAGPWGVSFAANLTPDSASGIGGWTEIQFKKALTLGKFKGQDGGRMLLPPMPWPGFAKLSDDDVHAIFIYLKSIKPVSNAVPLPLTPGQM